MSTPMAVLEMENAEVEPAATPAPDQWSWEPAVHDRERLAHAVEANKTTTKETGIRTGRYDTGPSY